MFSSKSSLSNPFKANKILFLVLILVLYSNQAQAQFRIHSIIPFFSSLAYVDNKTTSGQDQLVMEINLNALNLTRWVNSTSRHYVALTLEMPAVNLTAQDQIRCIFPVNGTGNLSFTCYDQTLNKNGSYQNDSQQDILYNETTKGYIVGGPYQVYIGNFGVQFKRLLNNTDKYVDFQRDLTSTLEIMTLRWDIGILDSNNNEIFQDGAEHSTFIQLSKAYMITIGLSLVTLSSALMFF
ncbi:UNKNOWN [Stylonychia lemnae]|uniref:Uncharacterized protein n=1 Tax=Stylonychia lemnae TaxID=5949 RepID=A0A078AK94_STYLE|nr:UNKNOWN [Stylonychia lemnae]|eukprot:CDW82316.1 UNKNOWN [Stylonychia lemnae]